MDFVWDESIDGDVSNFLNSLTNLNSELPPGTRPCDAIACSFGGNKDIGGRHETKKAAKDHRPFAAIG